MPSRAAAGCAMASVVFRQVTPYMHVRVRTLNEHEHSLSGPNESHENDEYIPPIHRCDYYVPMTKRKV